MTEETDPLKVAEQRGYSKGYNAGQRRADREYRSDLANHRRAEFERAVFLAILPELVEHPWSTNGKRWTTTTQFVDGAWGFARLAANRTAFSGERFDG